MSVIELLPATSRTMSYGERYRSYGYKGPDLAWNIGVLARIANRISTEAFGIEREEAAREIMSFSGNGEIGSIVIVALADTREAIAYSTQRILEPTIEGRQVRVMLTTTRAVMPDHAGKGVGPVTLDHSFNMHDAPDILMTRTGMAQVANLYDKSGKIKEVVRGGKRW